MSSNFNALKEKAKKQAKNIVKKVAKKILITVLPWLLGIIILAGGFFVVEEKLKDAADKVVKAASNITSAFDNTSDSPIITVSDDLIDQIKKEMKDESMDIEESYLTDALLKASISAYYATQYPYIDGIDYGDEDNENFSNIVKGCIYLKRGNEDMSYTNYNNFSSKMGSGKSISDRDSIKNSFSVDNEGNIVIATWSMSNTVTETINENNTYDQEGSDTSASYDITEYKIDQKTLTGQYAMSYKFPILLANMYSNEGFGIAVARLGTNSKIVLTVLDSTTENTTVSKEYMKLNYKVNGTYNWRDNDNDDLQTSNFSEMYWEEDHTQENNVYKITTTETETNQVTVKPTSVETWSVKGDVSDVKSNESTNNENNETEMENDSDYKEDTGKSISNDVIETIKNNIVNARESGEEGPATVNSIESVNAKVSKKTTDHKMKTEITTKETTYTSSDMELKDNTDKFLALIKADSNGNYDQNGSLVKYLKKGAKVNDTVSAISSTSSTSGGDYIVDTTKSDSSLVIKDKKTLEKAFKGYTTNEKLLANVDTFLDMQQQYNVNAVFAAAVSINETTAGTAGHGVDSCHNWFNYQPISGMRKGDDRWAAFSNDSEGIMGFGQLIATSPNYYFSKGQNTVSEIGKNYCEGNTWADNVTKFMNNMYRAAGINVKTESSSSSSETGSSTNASGDGYTKTYTANGRTYKEYKQGQGTYAHNVKYSGGTISSSGCGPTSVSIVASGYGKNYTPGTLVEAARKKYHVSNFTASPDATGKMLTTAGLNYTETFSLSKEQLKSHLNSGRPVVMSVDNSCGGLFTNNTHYIAILDINKKGDKVYVANPSNKASGWIDINKVIKCNSSSSRVAFLITSK